MFLSIKRLIKDFKIIIAFVQGILFPINYYLLRKSLNFPEINLLYKSKFNKDLKFWLSSVTLKDKKFTSYRLTPRYFLYYKGYLETSLTSVKFLFCVPGETTGKNFLPLFFTTLSVFFTTQKHVPIHILPLFLPIFLQLFTTFLPLCYHFLQLFYHSFLPPSATGEW